MTGTETGLVLEVKDQNNKTVVLGDVGLMTPFVHEGYWKYRVRVSEKQAVVGFPKFSTIGIGFAVEEDWNTNFPYTVDAAAIYDHIEHNKGDDSISRERVIRAIEMIQDAVRADRASAS